MALPKLTATLHQLELPFRRPFGHVLATRDRAEALVLVLTSDEGPGGRGAPAVVGVGECVPRAYVTGETFETVWRAIRGVSLPQLWQRVDRSSRAALVRSVEQLRLPALLGGASPPPGPPEPPGPPGPRGPSAEPPPRPALAAACAVELALLDLACKLEGWYFAELAFEMGLPAELLSRQPLAETISIPLDFTRAPAELAPLVGSRLGHLKVKVGADLAADVRRLRECRQLFGPALSLSVDANMAWSLEEALRAAEAFAPFGVAWYEEPLQPAARPRYRELRERAGVAVMLDEAACSFEETRAAITAGACDLINLRLSKCGGYLSSLRLAELAAAAAVRCQHGTQVGQLGFLNAAGRHFTSTVRGLVACEGGPGLANLRDFPTTHRLELDWNAGHLVGLRGPGLGAEPDPAKLRQYTTRATSWDGTRWS
jgi:L-Ala-D/L-Glu epimerase